MHRKHLLISLFLLLNGVGIKAQDTLDFEKLSTIMFIKNPTLYYDSLDLDNTLNKLKASKNSKLPDLNFNIYNAINNGRSLDPITYQYSQDAFFYNTYRMQSNVNIFEGGKINNTIDKYKIDLGIKEKIIQDTKINLNINLFSQYSEVCMLKEIELLFSERIGNLSQLKNNIKARINAGSSTNAELGLVEININNIQQNLNTILLKKAIAEYKIKTLLGYTIDSTLHLKYLSNIIVDSVFYNKEQLLYIADNSISSNLSKDRIHYAFNNIQLERSSRYPTLSLGGVLGSGYSSDLVNNSLVDKQWTSQLNNNSYHLFYVNLYIPIFSRFSTKYSIQNSKIQYQQSISKSNENKNELTQFLSIQNSNLQTSYKNYILGQNSLSIFNNVLNEANKNLKAGRINMIEYITIHNQKADIEENIIISKYNYLVAQKNIEFLK